MCIAAAGRVIRVIGRQAEVEFDGLVASVRVDYIPDISVGEFVLVHAGFAISRVDEDEARKAAGIQRELLQLLRAQR